MIKLIDLILESIEESKVGCLMLYFNFANWNELIKKLVDKKDIYLDEEDIKNDYGYETEPHCTILYGFHHYGDIAANIKKYLINVNEVSDIVIKNISIFENEDYDVVKYEINSNILSEINSKLRSDFEHTNDNDNYEPHITIAYVKKGEGKKYIKNFKNGKNIKGYKYVYSDPEYNKINII